MLACVTGGTGFVGSHLVRLLHQHGHRVRVLHRATSKLTALQGLPYESAIGDVTDLASMQAAFAGCDWVFHAAAVADYWQADHEWMYEVNVEGTRKVLQAARDAGVRRVIFTSSGAAVGMLDGQAASDESVPFNLSREQFPYGYSKVLAEQVVAQAVANGQDVVTLNPTVIIGPGDLNLISGTFIIQTAQWQWLTPISYGGIGVTDVRDVAATHLAAAERGRTGERYLICTSNLPDHEWFGMIADALNVAHPVFKMPTPMLPLVSATVRGLRRVGIHTPIDADQVLMGSRYIYFDASKAHQELHQPQIDMRQSVEDTVRWYQEHGFLEATAWTQSLRTVSNLWRSNRHPAQA